MNLTKLLKSLFGDKSTRDMKLIQPFVEKVKSVSPNIENLDNDALRARTLEIRKNIQESVTAQRKQIDDLKAKIEETPIDERADIFAQIDKIEKDYGKAAYGTIRTFVQKFNAMGLMECRNYSNRPKYRIR